MDRREHAAQAARLLATGSDVDLPYAALELRLAMEEIVYAKLRLYANRLPGSVIDTWQPPQALKALLQFEPHADRDFRLRIAEEDEHGRPKGAWQELGEHRSFKLSWLRKEYNRLGNLLHVLTPKQKTTRKQKPAQIREALIHILHKVERVVESQMDSSLATTITFDCVACDKTTIFNEAAAREKPFVVCLNCGAEHFVRFADDGSASMTLVATDFECLKCKALTTLENRHLEIGYMFRCKSCNAEHVFMEKHWAYGAPDSPAQGA